LRPLPRNAYRFRVKRRWVWAIRQVAYRSCFGAGPSMFRCRCLAQGGRSAENAQRIYRARGLRVAGIRCGVPPRYSAAGGKRPSSSFALYWGESRLRRRSGLAANSSRAHLGWLGLICVKNLGRTVCFTRPWHRRSWGTWRIAVRGAHRAGCSAADNQA
jgi:hypothetical protein